MMYVLNKKAGGKNLDELKDPSTSSGQDLRWETLMKFLKDSGSKWVIVDARIEEELKDFAGAERDEMRKVLGADDVSAVALAEEDGINDLIRTGYELLNLITYFTTGEKETRAWTIGKGWTAPLAGTAIHTDFKDKFIRAEVIEWDKLLEAGSFAAAKEKGWLRTEGKEYIVKDGDVMEFKI